MVVTARSGEVCNDWEVQREAKALMESKLLVLMSNHLGSIIKVATKWMVNKVANSSKKMLMGVCIGGGLIL